MGAIQALVATLSLAALLSVPALAQKTPPAPPVSHGLSMYGDLKYGPSFRHFDYVNPDAPKGGLVKLAAVGTFDNLNPFILKGVPAVGIGGVFETLTVASSDEAFAEYGLLAESVELPADRSWVAYTLRAEARFHDGTPVTADDAVWTFQTLRAKGHPFYRAYYAKVASVEALGPRKVRFTFAPGDNRELALITGQMPVLSRAAWSRRPFDRTTLEPPLGSGAYRVESVDPGRSITYRRVPDYWGAKLPVNVGRFNFDVIRYDYYRDSTVSLEAFKAGAYDFRDENSAKAWARGYDSPALRQGLIRRETIRHEIPTGLQGFVYNTRRPALQDRRVRAALAHAFDFEWSNAHLFYGAYTRTASYFSNSELASRGLPSPEELAVLEPFRGRVPDEVFTREYRPPTTDGSGFIRPGVIEALALLREAGWVVRDQRLVNGRTGEPMSLEILIDDASFERIALPFVKNLERLGVAARVRTVDAAQYQYRLDHFDFDLTVVVWGQSLSPGNEQRDFWSTEKADVPGSRNLAGIKDPVVDALIDLVVAAPDRASLIARTRALDRVLLWGHYAIPHYHFQGFRLAYWDRFGRPRVTPRYSLGFDGWWIDPAKAAALDARRGEAR
ncbi:MAG: extracellular solute-binding protein [Candidatus Rokuibacteriota bacterium]